MNMFMVFGIVLISYPASYLLVAGIRRCSEQRRIMDIPNPRSLHTHPVPLCGGLAIVFISIIGLIIIGILRSAWPWSTLFYYVSGATLIAVIGLLDDLHSRPIWVRMGVHLLSAALVILGIGYWSKVNIPFLDTLNMGWLGLPFTFLWIVGLTNAYNFMDGIDGIASLQAVVAGLGWAILGWLGNQPLIAVLGLLLAASSLGFLGHNWPPARIFMGDVGSTFLGFTFAVIPVVAAQRDPRFVLIGVVIVWPFIFDTVFTFLHRILHRENVLTSHCSHIYQRLVKLGFSQKTVALLYGGLSMIGVVLAVAQVLEWRWADYLTVIVMIIAPLFLWLGVRWKGRSNSKTAKTL